METGEANAFYAFHPGPTPSAVDRHCPSRPGPVAVTSVEEWRCPDLLFQDADSLWGGHNFTRQILEI